LDTKVEDASLTPENIDEPTDASLSLEQSATTLANEIDEPTAGEIAKSIVREFVETIVLALIMVFLIQLVVKNFRVDGHSMDPNLHHGQYLVVDKLSYKLPFDIRPPQRGDVIVFVPPNQPTKDFVKRIIGLPGDTVEIREGDVYINNSPLPNTFGARLDRFTMPPVTVPAGELFVLGDNRANSNDSRNWVLLRTDQVVGKAWLSYWPPGAWGTIPNNRPTASATLSNFLHWSNGTP